MSVKSLQLSEVAKLSDKDKDKAYKEFLHATASLNGELEELDRRIASFERVYEVSSETMQQELLNGRRKETAEIGQWLLLIELRNRVRQQIS